MSPALMPASSTNDCVPTRITPTDTSLVPNRPVRFREPRCLNQRKHKRIESENERTYETTTFAGKCVLVTGANRGLGQALVDEAHQRVLAGTRQALTCVDAPVTPGMFDVTDRRRSSRPSTMRGCRWRMT